MRRVLRRLLGRRPAATSLPGEAEGAEVLEFLEVPPVIVSWAQVKRHGLEGVWAECPRADWLLAIAGRAGVPLERLIEAARSLELPLGKSAWANSDELIADLGSVLDGEQEIRGADEIDPARQEELAAMANEARSPFSNRVDRISAAAAAVDEAHETFHRRRAELIREAIPYRDIRAALYGTETSSPYR